MRKLALLYVVCSGLIGCTTTTGDSPTQPIAAGSTKATPLSMGALATIPVDANGGGSTFVTVFNNSDSSAHLQGAKIYGDELIKQHPELFVHSDSCALIPAHASCNVPLTAPQHSGSFVLTLNYDIGAASQIVSYQSGIPKVNNLTYDISNLKLTLVDGHASAFSIPVRLGATFNNLSVGSSDAEHIKTSLKCTSTALVGGSLCTISGLVDADAFALSSLRIQGQVKGSSNGGFHVVLPMSPPTYNNAPYVASTFSTIIINPADGNHPQDVMLYNSGTESASNITITPSDSSVILTNTSNCSFLEVGQPCTFQVNANVTTTDNKFVTVTYSGDHGNGSTSFNVYEAAPNSLVSAYMVSYGTLTNIESGSDGLYFVKVNNNGLSPLESFSFVHLPTNMSYSSSDSTCNLQGGGVLSSTESCVVAIKYTPQTGEENGNLNFYFSARYHTATNESFNYTPIALNIPYSSFLSGANISNDTSNIAFSIKADGKDSQESTIIFTNQTGDRATTIEYFKMPDNVTVVGTNNAIQACIPGATQLAPHQQCSVTLKFGPTTTNQAQKSSSFQVFYYPFPGGTLASSSTDITTQASTTSAVSLTSLKVSTTSETQPTGSGSFADPYTYYNYPGNQLIATLTYTNTGLADANNFNIRLESTLATWLQVDQASSCGYGNSTVKLAMGNSCTLVLRAVNQGINRPYNKTGTDSFILPGYSYVDDATGVVTNAQSVLTGYADNQVWVNMNQFITPTTSTQISVIAESTAAQTYAYTFQGSDADAAAFPITVYWLNSGGLISTDSPSSKIQTKADFMAAGCTINFTLAAGVPVGNYIFPIVVVTSNGSLINGWSTSMTLQAQ